MITHEYLRFQAVFDRPMGNLDTLRHVRDLRATITVKHRRNRSKFADYVGVLVVDGYDPKHRTRVRAVRRIKLTGDQMVRLKARRSGPVLVAGRPETTLLAETGEPKRLEPIGFLAGFEPVKAEQAEYGPAFAPGDRVRVVAGAYAGTIGHVDDYSPALGWAVVIEQPVASGLNAEELREAVGLAFWYETHEIEAVAIPAAA